MARHKNNQQDVPPHYLVTVSGTFAYKGDDDKKRASYKFKIPVPVSVNAYVPERTYDEFKRTTWVETKRTIRIEDHGILSYLLKQNIIKNRIQKTHPGVVCIMTHEIDLIEASNPNISIPTDPMVLNKVQLLKLIKDNAWSIETGLFLTTSELRTAVLAYREHPASYPIHEGLIRRRRAGTMAFATAQDELDDLYDDTPESATSTGLESEESTHKDIIV
jgi:hypothetical protein